MTIQPAFERMAKAAAKVAASASKRAVREYRKEHITDEPEITSSLKGQLDGAFSNASIGGLTWSTSIPRHGRGVANEEGRTGADLIIHVSLNTPQIKYSKGVLIQAKRVEPLEMMSKKEHQRLLGQCGDMLKITPAAFVFNYGKNSLRCASATKVAGSKDAELYPQCDWTEYRFFLELFRCPIGDPRISSALVKKLPVPNKLLLSAEGDLGT